MRNCKNASNYAYINIYTSNSARLDQVKFIPQPVLWGLSGIVIESRLEIQGHVGLDWGKKVVLFQSESDPEGLGNLLKL